MHNVANTYNLIKRAAAAGCALVLAMGLTACGSSDKKSEPSANDKYPKITGVKATGKPGKKPKISFDTPLKVTNDSYAILQEGNGATLKQGQGVCVQDVSINAKDGSELMSTWEKNTPDCSLILDKDGLKPMYYDIFKDQRVNSTIAFGVNDGNKANSSYIMALTIVGQQPKYDKATGDKVKNIPSDLPKVTLNSKGAPSIDFNGYQPNDKLVSQSLIEGKGNKVAESDTIEAHYTGWVMDKDGKPSQFDSSWDRGKSTHFSLEQVVEGWKKGLAGHTVGSQVLLVIPPELGYKDKAQEKIPANSTLYFVVDILYDYGPVQMN
jgi:peptidylprolyl isomerase